MKPKSDKGVRIVGKGNPEQGVTVVSKHDGESTPDTEVHSRVVGHEEFGKTKKLADDDS